MPYRSNRELPERVRGVLPERAQDIYRKAYNSAWAEYRDPSKRRGGASREETAHRVAWAAVGNQYEKRGDRWVRTASR